MSEPYDIQVAAGAARAIHERLPEGVAAAVVEFVTGSLIAAPRRVGKPLRRELAGLDNSRGQLSAQLLHLPCDPVDRRDW